MIFRDKITKQIDAAINEVEAETNQYDERVKKIIKSIARIYTKTENLNCKDLNHRLDYLSHCRENSESLFTSHFRSISITVIVTLLSIIIPVIWESDSQYVRENSGDWMIVVKLAFPTYIVTLLIGWMFSRIGTYHSRKYHKYNIIDFEVEIINSLLEIELEYSNIKAAIVSVCCSMQQHENLQSNMTAEPFLNVSLTESSLKETSNET